MPLHTDARQSGEPTEFNVFLTDLDHHWRTLAAHPSDCAPLFPEGKRQNFAH